MEGFEDGLNIVRQPDCRSFGDILSDWQAQFSSTSTREFLKAISIDHCVTDANYCQIVAGSLRLPEPLVAVLATQVPPDVASPKKLTSRGNLQSATIPVLEVSEQDLTIARCNLLRAVKEQSSDFSSQRAHEHGAPLRNLLTTMIRNATPAKLPNQGVLFENLSAYLQVSPSVFVGGAAFESTKTEALTAALAALLQLEPSDFERLATRMQKTMCQASRPPPTTKLGQMLRCSRQSRGLRLNELQCAHQFAVVEQGAYPSKEELNSLLDKLDVSPEERRLINGVQLNSREAVPPKIQELCSRFPNGAWTPTKLLDASKKHPQLLLLRTQRIVDNVRSVVDSFSISGLSTEQYQKMTLRRPRLLSHKPFTIINNARNVIDHFSADGLTDSTYIAAAQAKPELLLYQPDTLIDHLERSIEFFSEYGIQRNELVQAAIREPALFTMRPDRTREAIEKIVAHFSKDGLTAEAYVKSGIKCPMIFSRDPNTVIGNIEILCNTPHSNRHEIVAQVTRAPKLLGLSSDNMLLRSLDAALRDDKLDFWASRKAIETRLFAGLNQQKGGRVLAAALVNDGLLPSIEPPRLR